MKKILISFLLCVAGWAQTQAQSVKVDEANLHLNGKLNIKVEHAENCLAMGYKLDLPEGIEVISAGVDNFLAPSHGIWSYENKYVVISEESLPLPQGNGTNLVSYELRATSAQPGTYKAKVTDIQFATKRYKLTTLPDVAFNIVVADYDNIEAVEVADGSKTIYSLSGMKLSRTQKGVNIIRQEDGTIRKVFK